MLLIGPLEREIRHWDDAPVGSDNSNVSHSQKPIINIFACYLCPLLQVIDDNR